MVKLKEWAETPTDKTAFYYGKKDREFPTGKFTDNLTEWCQGEMPKFM